MSHVGELHVAASGPPRAPLVILVHGTMDRSAGFAKVARRLEAHDRRGYARSRGVGPPYSCEAQVDDLLSMLDGRPATVVGHSYGGNVALAASVRAPGQVQSVGCYEVPLQWYPWWPGTTAGMAAAAAGRADGPEEAAEVFLRRILGDELWERLPEPTRHERRAEGHALVGELVDLRTRAPWRPEDITVPVLVGHGTKGALHHVEGATFLVEHLPRAKLVVIEGAGHNAHTSHPEAFARFVEEAAALT
jgi:pimeloyl-ACP methyl ester carboxylesterase